MSCSIAQHHIDPPVASNESQISETLLEDDNASSSPRSASPDSGFEDNISNDAENLDTLPDIIQLDDSFNLEIKRLISFPDSIPYSRASILAKKGFYFIKTLSILVCQFCRTKVDVNLADDDLMTTQHQCQEQNNNKSLSSDLTNYRYETNRIISFLRASWNKEVGKLPVGALDLARWGFYYFGEPDVTCCIFCRLEVRGWEVGDTAEVEHRRWNSNCPFINDRTTGNVKLGDEHVEENDVDSDRVGINHNVIGSKLMAMPGVLKASPPKHPEYATMISRLESYKEWPMSLNQKPDALSTAGFYYTGKGDRVICYQCGGGLKDWEADDKPWVEHAKWFSRCLHLILQKGQKFIDSVIQYEDAEDIMAETSTSNSSVEPMDTQQETEAMQQTELPFSRQCKVCMDKELGIVFLPCGHMASCIDCAAKVESCPLCRAKLTAYIRAFLP